MRALPVAPLAAVLALALAAPARAAESPDKSARPSPYFSVRFNPAARLIGRTSGEVEAWILPNVSLLVNVFHVSFDEARGQSSYDETSGVESHLTLDGFELGARYAQLHREGPLFSWGPFVGIAGGPAWGRFGTTTVPYNYTGGAASGRTTTSDVVQQLTLAAEGGLALFAWPFMVDFGFGLQATRNVGIDPRVPCHDIICVGGTHAYYGNGVTPRFLVSLGFAI